MVLIKYARDLDLHDRSQTRRRLHVQARTSNQLPENSAGNSQLQLVKDEAGKMPAYRTQNACAPQKENQCQES